MADKKNISGRSIPIRNIFFQYLNTAVTFIFPIILFPYLTRILSPDGYGRIGFYEAAFQIVTLLSMFGIPYFGIREWGLLDQDNSARGKLVSHLFLFNLLLSLLAIICFVFFMMRPGLVFSNNRLTLYYGLLIFFSAFSLDWYFQAEERFRFIFRRTLLTKIFLLIAVFLFVKDKNDFTRYVFITLIIYFLIAVSSIVVVLKDVLSREYVAHFKPASLVKMLAPFAGLGILAGFYINVDTLILGHFADSITIGYYTVANKIARMVIAVLVSTTIVFFARIVSVEKGAHHNSIHEIHQYSFSYLLHITLPAAALVWFFGAEIVMLLSGNAFMPAVGLLPFFACMIVVVALHDFFVIQVLLTHHEEKNVFRLMLVATVISIFLNLVLIKTYGMKGAVISTLITECFVLAVSFWLSKDIFIFGGPIRKQVFLSLISIPIVYFVAMLVRQFTTNPMLILIAGSFISFGTYCLLQLFVFRNSFFVEMLTDLRGFSKEIGLFGKKDVK